MGNNTAYYHRDLSWLGFNERILLEAADASVPVYERIKFLAIYSSNLDEFFRVRVASLRALESVDKKKIKKNLGFKPKAVLEEITQKLQIQLEEFGRIYREELIPELAAHHIILYANQSIEPLHERAMEKYFKSKILGYLQPVIIDGDQQELFLENRKLYFFVALKRKDDTSQNTQYAILNIPSEFLPRFIELPKLGENHYYIFLDDIVRNNVAWVFPNFEIEECYSIKINRDADLDLGDEFEGNLVEKIEKHLNKRQIGLPIRFLYDKAMPQEMRDFLQSRLTLTTVDMVSGGKYHNFFDFFQLPNPMAPLLEHKSLPSLEHTFFEQQKSIFNAIDVGDQVLHFPYHSYDYILRFFNEAAIDPYVQELRVTVYRIAANSFIANALISAAKNGKKVTVFVEVKARFDEANNLHWAAKMEKAGVNIIYSIPDLKVHAKIALATRNIEEKEETYALLSTGNFNENTAKIYADHAIMTKDPVITSDLLNVFEYLEERKELPKVQELLVAQVNMQQRCRGKSGTYSERDLLHKTRRRRCERKYYRFKISRPFFGTCSRILVCK